MDGTETPTDIVLDVADERFLKVAAARSDYDVEKVSAGRYIVRKGDSTYMVAVERDGSTIRGSCDCPDWRFHARKMRVPCKHIWLAADAEGYVKLPPFSAPPAVRHREADGGVGGGERR